MYMKETERDVANNEGLVRWDGIEVGACIRADIFEEEHNVNTVSIADDCCCEF